MTQPRSAPREVSYWEIFFVVGLLALPSSVNAVFMLLHPTPSPLELEHTDWYFALHAMNTFFMTGVLYLFLRRGGETLQDFTRPFQLGDVGWGIALGVIGFGATVSAFSIFSRFPGWFGGTATPNLEVFRGRLSPFYLAAILINPVCEESFMRGYLQTRLRQKGWWSVNIVCLSVLVQSFYHIYQGLLSAFVIAATFLVFAVFYQRTGRLWPVVMGHAIIDAAMMLDVSR